MNRGSFPSESRSFPDSLCFNEAPIHESGKYQSRQRGDGPRRRFNEAPIHESGKSPNGETFAGGFSSFNEAPIHESGKFEGRHLPKDGPGVASMRPRFMNRGSHRTDPLIVRTSLMLQ